MGNEKYRALVRDRRVDSVRGCDLARRQAQLERHRDYPDWLDERMLQRPGFDCSVNPESADAGRFYQRQQPRRAFVTIENDGPNWRPWLQRASQFSDPSQLSLNRSHPIAVDADLDAGKLRVRNPDRTKVLILPAVISRTFASQPGSAVKIRGSIRELPSSIHVPRPFSDAFHRLTPPLKAAPQSLFYQVHLLYVSAFEPIVTGVDFTK